MGVQITLERYDVQAIGQRFQFAGQMEPVGRVLDYLNGEGRSTYPLYDVKIFPIAVGGRLKPITRPRITVGATALQLIYFLDPEYRQRVELLRNTDRVIVYTSHAVLRGNFHRGVETRLGDLFDMMSGSFLAMTEVSLFPTLDLPAPYPQQVDLLIINRHAVDFYHLE